MTRLATGGLSRVRKPWLSPEVTSKDVHEVVVVVLLTRELDVGQLVVLAGGVVLEQEVLVEHAVHTLAADALALEQSVHAVVVTGDDVGSHQVDDDVDGDGVDNQDVVEGDGEPVVVDTDGVVVGVTSEGVTGDGLDALAGDTKVEVLDNLDRDPSLTGMVED